MSAAFAPGYEHFQSDVEAYLASIGKRERTRDGFVVYHGYSDALQLMFEQYVAHEAYDPLVAHFRGWNWENTYNDYLLRLTDALVESRDWPRLKSLWGGVIAKRRKVYNDVRMIEKHTPGKLPPRIAQESKERLLESLGQVRAFALALGPPEDAETYTEMIGRVEAGRKA